MTDPAALASEIILKKTAIRPQIAIILGSGLGDIAQLLTQSIRISYADLPDFPPCAVAGHAGVLHIGYLNELPVACLQGRAHWYEGVSNSTATTYVRTLKLIGCQSLLITNAAGSMREDIHTGDLVLIHDYINFQGRSVLMGPNNETYGPRFLGVEDVFNPSLRQKLQAAAQTSNIPLKEGVYFAALGPQFETPTEIHAFKMLGGDVVAMSAINEILVAHHCGMAVAMISAISNMASGMSTQKISHELTLEGVKLAANKLKTVLEAFSLAPSTKF